MKRMKRIKRIISILLAMLIMIMSASISIFAGFSNGNGIARSSDSDSATIDGSYYSASLYLGTTSSSAGGSGSNDNVYDYFRIAISSMVACNDCDLFDSDDGYGWMGNPGYGDTYIDFDGHTGIYADSYFDCYKNGNYVIDFDLHA
ncbi:MAG: hypothetical protein IKP68_10225 [Clostridia bacterium]|nr:hypothetical protein [Clostridia bacterium]